MTDPAVHASEQEEVIDADELGGMVEQEFPLEEAAATTTLPPKRVDTRTTLVTPAEEAEELRSRIRHPIETELELDEIEEEEDIEAISFDEPAPPPLASASMPAAPPAPPIRAAAPSPPPRVAAPVDPPGEPTPITMAPVSLELTAVPGRTDVSIPLELRLGDGTAQVLINLRLTLNVSRD